MYVETLQRTSNYEHKFNLKPNISRRREDNFKNGTYVIETLKWLKIKFIIFHICFVRKINYGYESLRFRINPLEPSLRFQRFPPPKPDRSILSKVVVQISAEYPYDDFTINNLAYPSQQKTSGHITPTNPVFYLLNPVFGQFCDL